MKTPILDQFFKAWVGMFTRSPKTGARWRALTGLPPPSYSVTRWWSRYEVLVKLMSTFGDVLNLLEEDDISPANASKLRAILEDAPKTKKLKMKLAVTVDCMELFIKPMYNLEGDGYLALEVYERLSTFVHCYHFQAHAQCESDGQSRSRRQFFV